MKSGDFVKVREDHSNPYRKGKDGFIIEIYENSVALFFGFDRHNQSQGCICVGRELWGLNELDIDTISSS
jgi:hypothetical protein